MSDVEHTSAGSRPRTLRLSRCVLAVLYVGLTYLGCLITAPELLLLLAPALGLLAAGLLALIFYVCEEPIPVRRTVIPTAWVTAGFVPFVSESARCRISARCSR